MQTDALLAQIKVRARDKHRASMMREESDLPELAYEIPVRAPVREEELASAEAQIGFHLPPLLRALYTEIGDGGFGPGYGLIPLLPPGDPTEGSVVDRYLLFRTPDPEEPTLDWPEGLIQLAHWGCAIYSCVDCAHEPFAVQRWDPNVAEGPDCSPAVLGSLVLERESLQIWLEAWLEGNLKFTI